MYLFRQTSVDIFLENEMVLPWVELKWILEVIFLL